MRKSWEKVRISVEAERVQSVSYSHIRSLLYLSFKGAKGNYNSIMYKYFSFKGLSNFTDFQCFIFPFEGSKFLWGAKCWREWILGPCGSVDPQVGCMECGWYGSACTPEVFGLKLFRVRLQSWSKR